MKGVYVLTFILVLFYGISPIAAAPILSASLDVPTQVEPYANFEAKLTLYNGGNSPAYMITPRVELPSDFKVRLISNYPKLIKPNGKITVTYRITASKASNPVSIKCSVSYSDNAIGKGTMMFASCDKSIIITPEGNRISQSYQLNIDAAANFVSSGAGVQKNFIVRVYNPDKNIISEEAVTGSKKFTVIDTKAGRYEIRAFGIKKLAWPFQHNEWPVSVSKVVYLTPKKPKADISIYLS